LGDGGQIQYRGGNGSILHDSGNAPVSVAHPDPYQRKPIM
jgi:hypothetical protein